MYLLTGGRPYFVEGLVKEDFGECSLTVKRLVVVNCLPTIVGQSTPEKFYQVKTKGNVAFFKNKG